MSPVAEYIKNIGKSVVYSTIDYTKENAPATSEFLESNEELFKDVYHSIRDFRGTLRRATDAVKDTPIYKESGNAFRNAIADIKSGKLYNKEREDEAFDAAFDLDSTFDMDGDDGLESSGESSLSMGEKSIMQATHEAATMQSHATTSAIEASTRYQVETSRANANMLYVQNARMTNSIEKGFSGVTAGLNALYQFNTEVVQTLAENSKVYFETTTNIMKESNAILKEMLEMQRNLYKQTPEKNAVTDPLFNILGANGMPNIKEYGKQIVKNIKNLASEKTFGMSDMINEDMLKMMASNPLAAIPSLLISTALGPAVKVGLKDLDKSVGGIFGSFLSKMNYMASKNEFGGSLGKEILGKIFGVRLGGKDEIDTRNTKLKGPTPFDWSTKRSIVEVIPSYLARIESALTGNPPQVYNDETGKWTNIKQLKQDFQKQRDRAADQGGYEEMHEMRELMNQLVQNQSMTKDQMKAMEDVAKKISRQRFKDGGWFDNTGTDIEKAMRYGVSVDEMQAYEALWNNISRQAKMQAPGQYMRARLDYSKRLQQKEDSGTAIERLLFNNFDANASMRTFENNHLTNGDGLIKTKDDYGMNIFDYLRNIDINTSLLLPGLGAIGGGPSGPGNRGGNPKIQQLIAQRERDIQNGQRVAAKQSDNTITVATGNSEAENSAQINGYLFDDATVGVAAKTVNDERRKRKIKENQTIIADMFSANVDDKVKQMQANGATQEEIDEYRKDMEKIINAASEGSRFSAVTDAIHKLTSRPAAVVLGMMEQADKHVFDMLFEHKDKDLLDEDGKPVEGLFGRAKAKFDELFKKIDEKIGESDKDREDEKKSLAQKANEYIEALSGVNVIDTANAVKDNVKNSVINAGSSVLNDVKDAAKEAKAAYDAIDTKADGSRNITKTGLTILSKGERVIPADQNIFNPDMLNTNRDNDRRNEMAIKRQLLENIPNYSDGKPSFDTQVATVKQVRENAEALADEEKKDKFKQFLKDSFGLKEKGEGKKNGPSVLSQFMSIAFGDNSKEEKKAIDITAKKVTDSLPTIVGGGAVGAIVGTATGLGGPLLGALAGAAVNFAANSNTVQRALFGERIFDEAGKDTGKRKGGIFSQETQETMQKYLPDMKKMGVAGTVLGLVTPLGPLGGLLMGSVVGFAKNNETTREALFGEAGLISKDTQQILKKSFPSATKGAFAGMLAGAGTGLGLLPGAVVGAGIGLVSSTDEFKDFLLGKPDSQGKRHGGVAGAINDGLVKPLKEFGSGLKENVLDWFKDKLAMPVINAMAPMGKQLNMGIRSLLGLPKTLFNKLMKTETGISMFNSLRYSKLGRGIGFLAGKAGALAKLPKKAIEMPSALIGKAGDKLRKRHIKQGNADYMTASERLAFMGDEDYDLRQMDETMQGTDREGLEEMRRIIGSLDEGKDYLEREEQDKLKLHGNEITKRFRDSGLASKVMKLIQMDDTKAAIDMVKRSKISSAEKKDLMDYINKAGDEIREIQAQKRNYTDRRSDMFDRMGKLGFKGINEDNYDKFKNLFKKEYSSREDELKKASDNLDETDPAAMQAAAINKTLLNGFEEQIPILKDMAESLKILSRGALTENQVVELNEQTQRGINRAHENKREMNRNIQDRANRVNNALGGQTNITLENAHKLYDKSESEIELFIDIGASGFTVEDVNELLTMSKKDLDRWTRLAKCGYKITDPEVISSLSEKDFDKLMVLAEAQMPITNIHLIKNLKMDVIQAMASMSKAGMKTELSGLAEFAKTGVGIDPNSQKFKERQRLLDESNKGRSVEDITGANRQVGIEMGHGNGVSYSKMDRARQIGRKLGRFGSSVWNASINQTKDEYYDAKWMLRGNNKNPLSRIPNKSWRESGGKVDNDTPIANINGEFIAAMADGGEVKKDKQPTIVSKGERIDSPQKNVMAESKDIKGKKSETINTEYGPQTYKLAMDGSMSLMNTKDNKAIQDKIADRDNVQKELLDSIKDLTDVNRASVDAMMGADREKKPKKGFWDIIKDLTSFMNPLNWVKKIGETLMGALGPLAPLVSYLGGKAFGLVKTGAKAVGRIAYKGAEMAWDKIKDTKLGRKLGGSKIGGFASKIAGKSRGMLGLDPTQSDDPAEAVNIHGNNIEGLLQDILDAIYDTGGIGGGMDLPGRRGKRGRGRRGGKRGRRSRGGAAIPEGSGSKWGSRAMTGLKVAGGAALAYNTYDWLTESDEEAAAREEEQANESFMDTAMRWGSNALMVGSGVSLAKDAYDFASSHSNSIRDIGAGVKDKVTGAASDAAEKAKPILEKVKSGLKNVIEKCGSIMGDKVKPSLMKFGEFIMEKVSNPRNISKIVSRATKKMAGYAASATGVGIAVTIGLEVGFAISSFYEGYNKAEEWLKIPSGTATMAMKMLCGFTAAVLQAIPVIGWVLDPEDVIDSVVKIVGPAMGVTQEIIDQVRRTGQKAETAFLTAVDKVMEGARKAGGLMSSAWDSVKGFGSDLVQGAKNTASSAWDKVKGFGSSMYEGMKTLGSKVADKASAAKDWVMDKAGAAVQGAKNLGAAAIQGISNFGSSIMDTITGKGKWGRGKWGRGTDAFNQFHSQVDPVNSMGYNTYGDTEIQSMADSGCGPASAANMAAALGIPMDTKNAAQYALDHGYKEKDGGTKPGFFKDYLGKSGIDTQNLSSQNDIKKSLKSGNPVLLMGTDGTNTPTKEARGTSETPFGSNPHYVVATGMDGDNITIQDPESTTPNQQFKTSQVLNKSSLAMSAGMGRWGRGKSSFGRGAKSLISRAANYISSVRGKSGRAKWGKGADNAETIWDWLTQEQGLSNQAAAGIMGNIQQECGFNPHAYQDGGERDEAPEGTLSGYGLCQWTESRCNNLRAFAAERGTSSGDLITQLEFMKAEATTGYNGGGRPGVWDKVAAAATPEEASKIWAEEFEGCGIDGARHEYAVDIFNKQGKGISNQSTGASGGKSGSKSAQKKYGGIFGELADIASTLSEAFTLPTANASTTGAKSGVKKGSPTGYKSSTSGKTASEVVATDLDKLIARLKNQEMTVEEFVREANNNPNTSRDEVQAALTSVGMWDNDTKEYFNKFYKYYDEGRADKKFVQLYDYYRHGDLNAKEFIAQADAMPNVPRELILNALQTATNYDNEPMWSESDLTAFNEYYDAKDASGQGRGKWGRSRWGRNKALQMSKNPTIQAYNNFANGRGGKVRWGKGNAGQEIFKGLVDRGFTKEGAAGVLGNIMQESTLDPNAQNAQGYHGLVQWDPTDRWPKAQAWITANGGDPNSIQGQLDYIKQESTERYDSFNKTNAASSPTEAASAWAKWFEGYENEMTERHNYAQQAYDTEGAALGGGEVDSSGGITGGNSKSGGEAPRKGILSKFQGIADKLKEKMQAALGPMAKAVTAGAEKMFGKDTLATIFGDDNPFASIFSGGGDSSKDGSHGGAGGSYEPTSAAISEASKWAESVVGHRQDDVNPPYWYGGSGCTKFVNDYLRKAGAPLIDEWVPTAWENAIADGTFIPPDQPAAEGDVGLIDTDGDPSEPDHVVIADGKGGFWSNLSSAHQIGHDKFGVYFGTDDNPLLGYIKRGGSGGTVNTNSGPGDPDKARAEAGPTSGGSKWGRGKWGRGLFGRKSKKNDDKESFFDKLKKASKKALNGLPNTSASQVKDTDSLNMAKQKVWYANLAKDSIEAAKNTQNNNQNLTSLDNIKDYIKDVPSDMISDANKISDDDNLAVARAKALKIRELYDKQTMTGTGKWGRGLKEFNEYIHRYDSFGDTKNLNTMDEIKEYIKDIPNDFGGDNKITDDDNLTVARAKALKLRELYDEELRKNNQYSLESQMEAQTIDVNAPPSTVQSENGKPVSTEIAPNGKPYEENDIQHLLNKGYTMEDAIKFLSTDPKYAKEILAPNGKPYEANDIKYLLNKGYTQEDAIKLLSTDPKYAREKEKAIAPNGKPYEENDIKYLLSKGYTYEDAIKFLSTDPKYTKSEDKPKSDTSSNAQSDTSASTQTNTSTNTTTSNTSNSLGVIDYTDKFDAIIALLSTMVNSITGNDSAAQDAISSTTKTNPAQANTDAKKALQARATAAQAMDNMKGAFDGIAAMMNALARN